MAGVRMVDVYVVRPGPPHVEVLLLRRAPGRRSPGSWEGVHGHVDPGEHPVAAAVREVGEETGMAIQRLYNLSRVESFYLHRTNEVVQIPVFAAFVSADSQIRLSPEHDAARWLPLGPARAELSWPRARRAIDDLAVLLSTGDAGPVDDVLWIQLPEAPA